MEPMDLHVGDSPDAVLWVTVELRVFHQDLRLRMPVLVEADLPTALAANDVDEIEDFRLARLGIGIDDGGRTLRGQRRGSRAKETGKVEQAGSALAACRARTSRSWVARRVLRT